MRFGVERVTVSRDVELPYVDVGSPEGVPTLFLHGFAGTWRSFAPTMEHLPSTVRAIAPTLRGHGEASKPTSGYGVRDFADDVARLMDALEVDSAVVVGQSMGGAIAQRFGLDHPGRTLGLVLVASSIPSGDSPSVRAFYEDVVMDVTDPVDPDLVEDFIASTLAQPIPGSVHDELLEDARSVPAHVWREVFRMRLATDLSAEIQELDAPTLLVWGNQDARSLRSDQEELLAAVPAARWLVYEGAGHDLHIEEPERFAADVAAFVREITA